jgi:hypothetical protein
LKNILGGLLEQAGALSDSYAIGPLGVCNESLVYKIFLISIFVL